MKNPAERDTLPGYLKDLDRRVRHIEQRPVRAMAGDGGGIPGPPGPEGPMGPPGPAGEDGADGADGAPGVGVPTGGTAGQVLAKVDGTDYNTHWVDQTGSGGGDGVDEVFVGVDQPSDPTGLPPSLELWYDPDATADAITGPPGPAGDDGTRWFDGAGAPVEPIAGANPGDYYLDTTTGNVWQLTAA